MLPWGVPSANTLQLIVAIMITFLVFLTSCLENNIRVLLIFIIGVLSSVSTYE
jgi:hypothetical protein